MKRVKYLSILMLMISFISCGNREKDDGWQDTITTGFIKIACDEDLKILMNEEIDAFEAHHNYQAIVTPIYTNETEAIRLLLDDSVRFALTTRDLTPKERADAEKKLIKVQKHLIAFDGIALITNNLNKDSIIGLPTLKKILNGEITEWSQINPDSQLGTIRVLFDNKESGVFRYVVDSIAKGSALSSNLYALDNTIELLDKITQMPNTLGLIGVNIFSDDTNSTYLQYKDNIRLVRISKDENANKQNSYLPYAGDIMQENYPLWRPVYVLLSDPRSGLSSGLSIFIANEIGQKVILKSGLLPITDPHIMPVIIKDEYPK